MSNLQKVLDRLVEEHDAYKEQQEQVEGDRLEDKSYYYYMGKAAGMRKAINIVEYHIKAGIARSRYCDRGYID